MGNIYIYIGVMALVTYLVRMIPFTLIRKQINNRFIKSFLYYVPFVALSVMTFPSILTSTGDIWSGLAGFITAVLLAFFGKGLFRVSVIAVLSAAAVLILQMII